MLHHLPFEPESLSRSVPSSAVNIALLVLRSTLTASLVACLLVLGLSLWRLLRS
jgi:hypothetical protein